MEQKNNNKGLIITLVIFIVITLVLGGYIVYDKVLNKKTNTQSSEVSNNNKNDNTQSNEVIETENSSTNNEVTLTSEQAFKMIEAKRKEINADTWSTISAKVIKKGDNNTYWVAYSDANIDGYEDSSLGIIFTYENGEWYFELPGFSGVTQDFVSKYNFVNVDYKEYFELNDDLAFTLIEGKRKELGYNTWTTKSAKVTKKGNDNYYLVSYVEKNNDGYDSDGNVLFHYENGKWDFDLPGFSGMTQDFISKYNFVDVK